jgi:hypothetical protein
MNCSVSIDLLLDAAERLIAHGETPLATPLLDAVLHEFPTHPRAHRLRREHGHTPAPVYDDSKYYVDHDYHTGQYAVLDEHDEHLALFDTRQEAEEYLKRLL